MQKIERLSLLFFQVLCLLLPTHATTITNLPVGTIEGSASVSLAGSATYQIPILVPTGENGFAPSVNLCYDSNSGDQVVGYGWNIMCGSSIVRCGSNHYFEGRSTEVALSTSDNLMLDGKRLLLASGTNLEGGSIYYPENDPGTKIVCHTSNTAIYFVVYRRDGSVSEYGCDEYSSLGQKNEKWLWLLKKTTDMRGRTITYTYSVTTSNVAYITNISYDTNRSIRFSYEPQPHSYPIYYAGQSIIHTKRLCKISSFINDTKLNEYQLSYDDSDIYSRLIDVTLYDDDGNAHFNSTHINYEGQKSGGEGFAQYSPGRRGLISFYGDIDGDGRTDVVSYPMKNYLTSGDYLYAYLSKSKNGNICFELVDSIKLGSAFYDVTLRDIDGDGVCNIALRWANDGETARYDYYSCVNEQLSLEGSVTLPWSAYDVGDYDGDGRADFFCRVNEQIYDLHGKRFALAYDLDWDYFVKDKLSIPSWKMVCDVNGNGKEDFLVLKDYLKVYEASGFLIKEITSFANENIRQGQILAMGDYNGDGLTDIIAQNSNSSGGYDATLYLSSGRNYLPVFKFTVSTPVRVGDFNKDGKSDVFYRSEVEGRILYNIGISRGNSFDFSSNRSVYLRPSHFQGKFDEGHCVIADFDGDGMDEMGLFCFNDVVVIKNFQNNQNLVVSDITDGLGKTVEFYYTPSSISSVCTFSQEKYGYPLARPAKPLELVSSMEVYQGKTFFKTNYTYQNPTVHLCGKGFLGFSKYVSSDETRKITSITSNTVISPYYYPYSSEIEVKSYNDDWISRETKTVNCKPRIDIHSKAFVSYVSSQESCDYSKDIVVKRETTIDDYGNPTEVVADYGDGLSDKSVIAYENIATPKWVVGQPTSITKYQYATSSNTKEKQVIQYDPSSRFVSHVEYFKGLTDEKMSEEDFSYVDYDIATHSIRQCKSGTALTTSYEYTPDRTNLLSVTDPFQLRTTYTYNGKGQRSGVVYPDGHAISYSYDEMGRLKDEISNDTTSVSMNWQWDNDVAGSVYCETKTTTDETTEKVWRDAFGREVRKSSLRFDGSELKIDYVYNRKGQLWKVSVPYKNGEPTQWDEYSYTDDGKLSSIINASGKSIDYDYDGRSTTITTDGITITKTVNAKDELIKVSDPKGDIIYTLRPDGQPEKVEALGVTTLFDYDSLGRRVSIDDPSASLRSFVYNDSGQLDSEIDADGRLIKYKYDMYGRLSDVCRQEMTTHYSYDDINRLVNISSDNGTGKIFTYDNLGRLVATKTLLPNNKYLQREYAYQKGKISSIRYSNQSLELGTERFTYANGCLNNISFNDSHVWQLLDENEMGQSVSDKSGPIIRKFQYDEKGLPSGRIMSKNNCSLMNYGYGFNATTGNLSWRKDVLRDKTEDFCYDNVNRLVSYGDNTIKYDNKGNILSKSDAGLNMSYSHSSKPYAMTSISPGFSLTAVRYSQQEISYNSFECPDTIIDNGLMSTYVYDADGERAIMLSKSRRLPTRYYVGNFYEEEFLSDTTSYRLYLGGDAYSAPAVYVWKGDTGSIYYIGRDHLGSITHITDESGNLLHEYSYDPWGRLRDPVTQHVYDVGQAPKLLLGRGYCGHEHLEWCGLINMNARLYDPTVGRFLSPDPYVQTPDFSQNFNRYSYCLNNPLRYTDLSGELFGWDDVIAMVVGGGLNLGVNLLQGNVNNFWQGVSLFGVGALAGEAALYSGGFAPYVAAGITSVGNDIVNQSFLNGSINWDQLLNNLIMSEAMAGFTCGLSGTCGGAISSCVSRMGIKGPAVNEMLSMSLTAGSVGAVLEGGLTIVNGGTIEEAFNATLRGGGVGLVSGAVYGFADGVNTSYKSRKSPWTGEKIQRHHSFPKALGGDPDQKLTPMSTSRHKNLHTDMNLHLKTYTTTDKGKTFDMYPRKGNKGYDVRKRFSEQARFNAVKNFYDLNPIKYYDARFQFYYNNGMLSRWRPW